jgi:hypothetical protein
MPFLKRILIVCSFCLLAHASKAQAAYCQLKGSFFEEKNPARIQYRVFVAESESFADLLVFKVDNNLFADKPGLWHLTDSRAQANYFISFTDDRSKADFSIYFIDTESFAGCQNSSR